MVPNQNTAIDASLLASVFEQALTRFVVAEREHILSGVSEQNLCFRLALGLEQERVAAGIEGYTVDTEHNRNRGELKTILDDQMRIISIRCDIILHSRGRIPAQDNLIAIEMKRAEHPAVEKEKDRMRLRTTTKASFDGVWSADGITLPEHICGYVLGYYLELNAGTPAFEVEVFEKGKQSGAFAIPF